MNEKIVNMIVELAKTGGNTAIYMYGMYVVGTVLKYMIGFGCLLMAVKRLGFVAKEVAEVIKGNK